MNQTVEPLNRMQAHIQELCQKHGIVLHYVVRASRSITIKKGKELRVARVVSPISYALALYEIGHILGKYQNSQHVLVRERAAWKWARQNALIWTARMAATAEASLAWYRKNAAQIDKRNQT